PRPVAAASPASSAFDTFVDPFADDEDDAVPPLALTPEQIVRDPDPQEEPAPQTPVSAPAREMRAASVRPAAATAAASAPHPPAAAQEEPADEGLSPSLDDDVAFAVPPERPEPPVRPRPSAAQSAPLPDPALTSDLTEQL